MPLCIDDGTLLEKYETISTKIEGLEIIKLNTLLVFYDKHIKTKVTTYGDNVYTNFHDLIVPEDYAECRYFTVVFIGSLLLHENKYHLQVCSDYCAYKTVDKH